MNEVLYEFDDDVCRPKIINYSYERREPPMKPEAKPKKITIKVPNGFRKPRTGKHKNQK